MIYLILLLALLLRLWNLNQSLWLDEAAQAIESQHGISTIISNMPADFHPPLFHLLMHYWLTLGTEEWLMRLLPVLFGLGSIIFTYLIARNLFHNKIALISALFLASNPFHIYYSQELRPYMAGLFFAAASTYFLWKGLVGGRRWWVMFTLVTTAFFYTSYFAAFLVLAQLIFLLSSTVYRPKITTFLITQAAALALFLPWIPHIPAQLRISSGLAQDLPGWRNAVATPVFKALPLTLVKFIIGQINFRPLYLYGLISAGMGVLWGLVILKSVKLKEEGWRYLFILFAAGIMIPVFFSFYLQIVSPKRLIYVLPFLVIMLAAGLVKFKGWTFRILAVVLLAVNFFCLIIYQTNPVFQREDWRAATAKVEKEAGTKSIVLFKFSEAFAPYVWYASRGLPTVGLSERLVVGDEPLGARLNTFTKDKNQIFLFQYLEGLTDPGRVTDKALIKMGFSKKDTFDFPGVGLVNEYVK